VIWRIASVSSPPERIAPLRRCWFCDQLMAEESQEELSDLLERNREGLLDTADHSRLEGLMRNYRRGLVRRAQACHEAVARGLRPRLS
jgi:hypothetical protein